MSLLSVQKIAKMDEYKIIFDDVDVFCVIRFKDGGLDLLKSNVGFITYLTQQLQLMEQMTRMNSRMDEI